jgi:hypothetical protein
VIASSVPATTISTSEYSSCWKVGFSTHCPWMRPTRTAATGSANGMRLMFSASDAPVSQITSASFSWSAEMTWTEDLRLVLEPVGEERPERPVDEARGEDLLVGGPPLALDEPAGNLAGGVLRSRYSTVSGKNGRWVGLSCATAVHSTTVSPNCTGARAVRLPRHASGLDHERTAREPLLPLSSCTTRKGRTVHARAALASDGRGAHARSRPVLAETRNAAAAVAAAPPRRLRPDVSTCSPRRSVAQTQVRDEPAVSLEVVAAEVVQEPPALAHHLQEALARVVILLVGAEVVREVVDARGEQRDLHLSGATVGLVDLVLLDDGVAIDRHGRHLSKSLCWSKSRPIRRVSSQWINNGSRE